MHRPFSTLYLLYILLFLSVFSSCKKGSYNIKVINAFTEKTLTPPSSDYDLVFSDDFNGDTLNEMKWDYRALGRRGSGFLVKNAISLDGNGHLVFKLFKSHDSVCFGMISTEKSFLQKYGYFECRVKLNRSTGHYPSFWLQSPKMAAAIDASLPFSSTAFYNGTEIDIFEYFDRLPEGKFIQHQVFYGGYGPNLTQIGPWAGWKDGLDTGYHTFGLAWTPQEYTFNIDGYITWRTKKAVSQVPEYVILSDLSDTTTGGPIIPSELPDSFLVDYVRIYDQRK